MTEEVEQLGDIEKLQTEAMGMIQAYLERQDVQTAEEAGMVILQLMFCSSAVMNANVGKAATLKAIQDVKRAASQLPDTPPPEPRIIQ